MMTFQCSLLLWQSFAQVLPSNAHWSHPHCQQISFATSNPGGQGTNLLNVRPDLHISCWSLLLGIIEFVFHCNIWLNACRIQLGVLIFSALKRTNQSQFSSLSLSNPCLIPVYGKRCKQCQWLMNKDVWRYGYAPTCVKKRWNSRKLWNERKEWSEWS